MESRSFDDYITEMMQGRIDSINGIDTIGVLAAIANTGNGAYGPWYMPIQSSNPLVDSQQRNVHMVRFTLSSVIMKTLAHHVQDLDSPKKMLNEIRRLTEMIGCEIKKLKEDPRGYEVSSMVDIWQPLCNQWFHEVYTVILPDDKEDLARFGIMTQE
mgnify:CR=1 FL=1